VLPRRYRALLALLPAHVRESHEAEMRDDLEHERPRFARFAADMVRAALVAHADVLRQDVAAAVRQLRRAPTFAVVAGVTLALGIAGNITFFALVDRVLLRPPPFAHADRIVDITEENLSRGMRDFGIAAASFADVTRDTTIYAAAALYQSRSGTVRIGDDHARVAFVAVTGDFFRVLGVPPELGRTLQPGDDVAGANAVVLSHAFWRRTFGGDAGVIGRELEIDGVAQRIVGVMPARFDFPGAVTDCWRPMSPTPWRGSVPA
jgi:hypothetical protein